MMKIAIFAFNPIRFQAPFNTEDRHVLKYYKSPFVIFGNIVWMVLFGWEIFLFHLVLALIQALTIVGIGNAFHQLQIAQVALCPFGRVIIPKVLPERPVKPGQVQNGQVMQV